MKMFAGIHYLVDYYAFFDIPPDADDEMIEHAYQVYTTKVSRDFNTVPQSHKKAINLADIANTAQAILHNPIRRAKYDELLEGWAWPKSLNGQSNHLIEFAFEQCVVDKSSDEILEEFDALFLIQSGYDSEIFEGIERLYSPNQVNTDDIKKLYFEQLGHRDQYLYAQELLLWSVTGVGKPDGDSLPSSRYMSQTMGDLTRAMCDLAVRCNDQFVLAKDGEVPFIVKGALEPATDESYMRYIEEKFGLMKRYQDAIVFIAQEREVLARKRLQEISPTYPYGQSVPSDCIAIGARFPDKIVWRVFRLPRGGVMRDHSVSSEQLDQLSDEHFAKEWIASGKNIVYFDVLPHIDEGSQVKVVIDKHIQRIVENL